MKRKIFPGTIRVFAFDVTVLADILDRNAVFGAQRVDENDQRIELRFGNLLFVEIADKADLDIIRPVGLHLALPAPADFHFAIAGVGAVADHKVIKKPSHVAAVMVSVEELGASLRRAAVMHRDRPPVGQRMP